MVARWSRSLSGKHRYRTALATTWKHIRDRALPIMLSCHFERVLYNQGRFVKVIETFLNVSLFYRPSNTSENILVSQPNDREIQTEDKKWKAIFIFIYFYLHSGPWYPRLSYPLLKTIGRAIRLRM